MKIRKRYNAAPSNLNNDDPHNLAVEGGQKLNSIGVEEHMQAGTWKIRIQRLTSSAIFWNAILGIFNLCIISQQWRHHKLLDVNPALLPGCSSKKNTITNGIITMEKEESDKRRNVNPENINKVEIMKEQNIEHKSVARGKRHWCVVTHIHMSQYGSRLFKHFPHAAEVLLPCWSYFYEQDVRDNCGIDFRLGKDPKISEWVRQLIEDAMRCVIQDDDVYPIKRGDVEYIPNLYHMRPRYQGIRWLNSADHAHALRRNLISDDDIAEVKGAKHPLQISLLQRNDTRHVDNMIDICEALRKALPEADIDIKEDFTTTTSIREQAWAFASKDIIIGPHGAAMTNAIFVTPKTVVLQMHPSGYFYQFFEGLIEQSGGIAIDWHNKTAGDPYIKHKVNHKNRDVDKKGHMVVPPEDIVERIMYFVGKKNPDRDQVTALYGNAWDMSDLPIPNLQLL